MSETPQRAVIAAAALDDIEHHAREAWPAECCGLLIGRGLAILESWRAGNEARGTTRYRVRAADHFAAIRRARAAMLEVRGIYHSHPLSGPVPSRHDAEDAVAGLLYLIVGPCGRRRGRRYVGRPGRARRRLRGWPVMSVALWRVSKGNFERVPFVRT